MNVLLNLQKLADISNQSIRDEVASSHCEHNPPIKRGQKRIEPRVEKGKSVHNGDRPMSRTLSKLKNRYSIDQKSQDKKIG